MGVNTGCCSLPIGPITASIDEPCVLKYNSLTQQNCLDLIVMCIFCYVLCHGCMYLFMDIHVVFNCVQFVLYMVDANLIVCLCLVVDS